MKMTSPLLKLPGGKSVSTQKPCCVLTDLELRNRIYGFVVADDDKPHGLHVKHLTTSDASAANYAGLTRVCRKIREEFLPGVYTL